MECQIVNAGTSGFPWVTFWAAASAIFTAVAACVAGWAMLQWRKQEELKVRLDFKRAVCDYAYQLTQMPPVLFIQNTNVDEPQCKRLRDLLGACTYAWFNTEGKITNKVVIECWDIIYNQTNKYLSGQTSSDDLGAACMGIATEQFVFTRLKYKGIFSS